MEAMIIFSQVIIPVLSVIVFLGSLSFAYFDHRKLKKERTFIAIRAMGWRDDAIVISNCATTIKEDIEKNPEWLAISLKSGIECMGQTANSIQVNITRDLQNYEKYLLNNVDIKMEWIPLECKNCTDLEKCSSEIREYFRTIVKAEGKEFKIIKSRPPKDVRKHHNNICNKCQHFEEDDEN